MRKPFAVLFVIGILGLGSVLVLVGYQWGRSTHALASPLATLVPTPDDSTKFAVIGDFGQAGPDEQRVADLVKSWNPSFVVTAGDDNYPSGASSTIDENIGQYYHDFIHPYRGDFGKGAPANDFYPALGNHDWEAPGAAPYLSYFTLPGNGRYYDVVRGPVHLFVIDSDKHEPDGVTPDSKQGQWLKNGLANSTSCWNLVVFHHPAYSSGLHGSNTWMQWPFKEWGASAVLSGHDHVYERLDVGGLPYFVNGLGGQDRYNWSKILPESQYRYHDNPGAMLVSATSSKLTFQFYSIHHDLKDTYVDQSSHCQ